MNKHEKFLEFNGNKILFLNADGVYWIALKPICEALKVDYIRCFKNVKNDPILAPALSEQTIQVSKNGKIQGRKMTCIPEKYIYGWIFSLNSDSEELTNYKRTCYELLYNHFHGVITNRKELLIERIKVETEIHNIKESLKQETEKYKLLNELTLKKKALNNQLNSIDKEMVSQPELFSEQ